MESFNDLMHGFSIALTLPNLLFMLIGNAWDAAMYSIYQKAFLTREWNLFQVLIIAAVMVGVIGLIVLVERGERRIPVQYAKRVVGNKVMGGQSSFLPLKVNYSGVMPVIFSSSILLFPQQIFATLAAYAIARLEFRGKRAVLSLALAIAMFPVVALVGPLFDLWRTLGPRHVFVAAFVLVFPFIATPFFTFQVASQSLILGLIALSLAFLAGYGGMVSLAQMTVAGMAGYAVAVLGASPKPERYSNQAIHLLRQYGHTVIPVNPIQREIAGLPVAAALSAITEKVDTVTVYVSPSHLEPLVDGLLQLGGAATLAELVPVVYADTPVALSAAIWVAATAVIWVVDSALRLVVSSAANCAVVRAPTWVVDSSPISVAFRPFTWVVDRVLIWVVESAAVWVLSRAETLVADSEASWATVRAPTWVSASLPTSVVVRAVSCEATRPLIWVVLSAATWVSARAEILVSDRALSWSVVRALIWVVDSSPMSVSDRPLSWVAVRPLIWVALSAAVWVASRAETLVVVSEPIWVASRAEKFVAVSDAIWFAESAPSCVVLISAISVSFSPRSTPSQSMPPRPGLRNCHPRRASPLGQYPASNPARPSSVPSTGPFTKLKKYRWPIQTIPASMCSQRKMAWSISIASTM